MIDRIPSRIKKFIFGLNMILGAIFFSYLGLYGLAITGVFINFVAGILVCLRENLGENYD